MKETNRIEFKERIERKLRNLIYKSTPANLKKDGVLRIIGSTKVGYWEVVR